MKVKVDNDGEANSGPTLKRLRLRGDWSDTGPQALPEREMRSQTGGKLSVSLVHDPSGMGGCLLSDFQILIVTVMLIADVFVFKNCRICLSKFL